MFWLNIDDVCLDINAIYKPEPTSPTNITADPAATTADVTWNGAEGDSWNLRYKVYNPNEAVSLLWDLTIDNYESQIDGWAIYDADEDGYVDLPNINIVEEMVGMISASRAYQANATVAENVKTMMQSAMNI